MNRRHFFGALGTALLVPAVPRRVYSFLWSNPIARGVPRGVPCSFQIIWDAALPLVSGPAPIVCEVIRDPEDLKRGVIRYRIKAPGWPRRVPMNVRLG